MSWLSISRFEDSRAAASPEAGSTKPAGGCTRRARLSSRQRAVLVFPVLICLLGLALVLGTAVGAVRIPPRVVVAALLGQEGSREANAIAVEAGTVSLSYEQAFFIVRTIRLPRVLLAFLTGSALAMSGVAFQGILSNPMADPYIIGVSSGAALGAAIATVSGLEWSFGGFNAVAAAAFMGSLAAIAFVFALATAAGRRKASITTLLLAGVSVSTILSAFVSLLMILNRTRLERIFLWLMGGLSGASWEYVKSSAVYVVTGGILLCCFGKELNAMAFGEEVAGHLGVNPERTKIIIVFLASLITGASVATTGLIGFIGLLVPHIARAILGPDNRVLIPASGIMGATLLVAADSIARTVMAPGEIPVGIITALIGGPFFLFLLYRETKAM